VIGGDLVEKNDKIYLIVNILACSEYGNRKVSLVADTEWLWTAVLAEPSCWLMKLV